MKRLLLCIIIMLHLGCQTKVELPKDQIKIDHPIKQARNPIEELILDSKVRTVLISQPLGTNTVTTSFDTKTNIFLHSKSTIIIDSLRYDLKKITNFELGPDNGLHIESRDPGVNYVRNMTQEKLDAEELRREETYSYEDIRLIDHPLLNRTAPRFVRKAMSGKMIDLHENNEKATLLNFWFLGCIPCLKQKQDINLLKQKFPNVEFISVAKDSIAHLSKYIDPIGESTFNIKKPYNYFGDKINFDIISDGQGIIDEYDFSGYPITFLINEEKNIVAVLRASNKYYENTTRLLKQMQSNI